MYDEKRFVLITEGGYHNAEYLWKLGLRPSDIVIDVDKFLELSPYLKKGDIILLIIKGLTDFTLSEVIMLISKLNDLKDKVGTICIFSNIEIPNAALSYYMYKGDLMSSNYSLVDKGKVIDMVSMYTKKKRLNTEILAKIRLDIKKKLFKDFKDYKHELRSPRLFSRRESSMNEPYDDEYKKKIIQVDLFK